jgi:hypothetical protein
MNGLVLRAAWTERHCLALGQVFLKTSITAYAILFSSRRQKMKRLKTILAATALTATCLQAQSQDDQ